MRIFEATVLKKKYDYLAPDGSEIRLLPELGRGGLAHCTLHPGQISAAKKHRTVEEIWYFVQGRGKVWRMNRKLEKTVTVGPGSSLTIPRGTHFQFRNTGKEPLCFLCVTMPPWPGKSEAVDVKGHWKK